MTPRSPLIRPPTSPLSSPHKPYYDAQRRQFPLSEQRQYHQQQQHLTLDLNPSYSFSAGRSEEHLFVKNSPKSNPSSPHHRHHQQRQQHYHLTDACDHHQGHHQGFTKSSPTQMSTSVPPTRSSSSSNPPTSSFSSSTSFGMEEPKNTSIIRGAKIFKQQFRERIRQQQSQQQANTGSTPNKMSNHAKTTPRANGSNANTSSSEIIPSNNINTTNSDTPAPYPQPDRLYPAGSDEVLRDLLELQPVTRALRNHSTTTTVANTKKYSKQHHHHPISRNSIPSHKHQHHKHQSSPSHKQQRNQRRPASTGHHLANVASPTRDSSNQLRQESPLRNQRDHPIIQKSHSHNSEPHQASDIALATSTGKKGHFDTQANPTDSTAQYQASPRKQRYPSNQQSTRKGNNRHDSNKNSSYDATNLDHKHHSKNNGSSEESRQVNPTLEPSSGNKAERKSTRWNSPLKGRNTFQKGSPAKLSKTGETKDSSQNAPAPSLSRRSFRFFPSKNNDIPFGTQDPNNQPSLRQPDKARESNQEERRTSKMFFPDDEPLLQTSTSPSAGAGGDMNDEWRMPDNALWNKLSTDEDDSFLRGSFPHSPERQQPHLPLRPTSNANDDHHDDDDDDDSLLDSTVVKEDECEKHPAIALPKRPISNSTSAAQAFEDFMKLSDHVVEPPPDKHQQVPQKGMKSLMDIEDTDGGMQGHETILNHFNPTPDYIDDIIIQASIKQQSREETAWHTRQKPRRSYSTGRVGQRRSTQLSQLLPDMSWYEATMNDSTSSNSRKPIGYRHRRTRSNLQSSLREDILCGLDRNCEGAMPPSGQEDLWNPQSLINDNGENICACILPDNEENANSASTGRKKRLTVRDQLRQGNNTTSLLQEAQRAMVPSVASTTKFASSIRIALQAEDQFDILSPASRDYAKLWSEDAAFRHACSAGCVWQSIVGQHVRFPSDWWGQRTAPLGCNNRLAEQNKWVYYDRHRFRDNRFLNRYVPKRDSPGQLLLHIIVRDFMTSSILFDVVLGCFHPNAKVIRTTELPNERVATCRDVWLATRFRNEDSISVIDPGFLEEKMGLTRKSPLGEGNHRGNTGKRRINNTNVRSIFGESPPLRTIFATESDIYETLSSMDEYGVGPADVLLEKYLLSP